MIKQKLITSILILLILIIPFLLHNRTDDIEAIRLDDSAVGYYQSTTCKISLIEFYLKNRDNLKSVYLNNNDYADINCFGKITGVDKVNNTFSVSIGTNTSFSILIQSLIWILILSFVPKADDKSYLTYKCLYILPFLLTYQHLSEIRFYSRNNILYNSEISTENLYLLGILILNFFITVLIIDSLKGRFKNLTNYTPFLFLFVGTYLGSNFNFYLIFFSCIGISFYINEKKLLKFDKYYIVFFVFWILNIKNNDYFFDGDKLRGFSNSIYSTRSQLFWILIIFFTIRGFLYLIDKGKELLNLNTFMNNFFIAGGLTVIFGVIGAISPVINFFNFFLFGQNKRGMKDFTSIAGNTWRGFSSSAESIGEVYGFILLIFLILIVNKKMEISNKYNLLSLLVIYGLIRSNNFASMMSFLLLSIIYLYFKFYKGNNKTLHTYLFFIFTILGFTTLLFNSNYDFNTSNLIYEATRHQSFYEDIPATSNQLASTSKSHYLVLEAIKKNDVGTILLDDSNFKNASSSYKFLFNMFTPSINIKFVPNIVGFISIVSLFINRSEMWGIFIAKYNPDIFEFLFGYGPQQLNEYLFGQKVRLDVPAYKASSLFLPHSSLLDLFIFVGLIGTIMIFINILKMFYNSNTKNVFLFPTIFLFLNFLKSDSILYLNSFLLILFSFQMLKNNFSKNE